MIELEKKYIKPASLMLSRAFKDEKQDIFPDPEERKIKKPLVNEFHIRRDFSYGRTFITSPRVEGIAIWMHSDRWNARPSWRIFTPGVIRLIFKIGIRPLIKLKAQERYMEKKHKELVQGKHWYLALLAVDPQYQGKGYGGKLLNGMLANIDKDNLPCYVETEGEKNVSMYKHFGFEVISEFVIPDTTDKLVAMLRQPKRE